MASCHSWGGDGATVGCKIFAVLKCPLNDSRESVNLLVTERACTRRYVFFTELCDVLRVKNDLLPCLSAQETPLNGLFWNWDMCATDWTLSKLKLYCACVCEKNLNKFINESSFLTLNYISTHSIYFPKPGTRRSKDLSSCQVSSPTAETQICVFSCQIVRENQSCPLRYNLFG